MNSASNQEPRGPQEPWWYVLILVLLSPLILPALLVLAALSIPYFWFYPDRHVTNYDGGSESVDLPP